MPSCSRAISTSSTRSCWTWPALFVLVGLGLAIYRRYIVRPDRLNTDWRFNLTLPLLALIILTGFLLEALRLAAMQPAWAPFSVVAYPISLLFGGLPESVLLALHRGHLDHPLLIVAVAYRDRAAGRISFTSSHRRSTSSSPRSRRPAR